MSDKDKELFNPEVYTERWFACDDNSIVEERCENCDSCGNHFAFLDGYKRAEKQYLGEIKELQKKLSDRIYQVDVENNVSFLSCEHCKDLEAEVDKLKKTNSYLNEYKEYIFDYAHKNLSHMQAGYHIADGLVREHKELKADLENVIDKLQFYMTNCSCCSVEIATQTLSTLKTKLGGENEKV